MKWITVDPNQMQIGYINDNTFMFDTYFDEYKKMDDHTLPLHWHKFIEYELVLSGKVEMLIADQKTILDVGDCAFVNANTLHSGTQLSKSEDAVVFSVCFTPDILTENINGTLYKKYFSLLYGKSVYGFKVNHLNGNNIYDILYSLLKLSKDSFGYELSVISKVSELWLSTIKYINENNLKLGEELVTHANKNDVMKKLMIYIQENYNKKITVDILSSYAYISHSECYRFFKQVTGKTPLEYVNDFRLSQAEHLLLTTSLPITTICLSCGFSGQSYFGEMFKLRYGATPAQYRKLNK